MMGKKEIALEKNLNQERPSWGDVNEATGKSVKGKARRCWCERGQQTSYLATSSAQGFFFFHSSLLAR